MFVLGDCVKGRFREKPREEYKLTPKVRDKNEQERSRRGEVEN